MLLQQSLRQVLWHLRLAHGGLVLRVGETMCLLVILAGLGIALGHAILGRRAWPDGGDD